MQSVAPKTKIESIIIGGHFQTTALDVLLG